MFFFVNDTATTEIYTLSLHDALPISLFARINAILDTRWFSNDGPMVREFEARIAAFVGVRHCVAVCNRSEEHTSELQSRQYLVCRLLLDKKKLARRASIARIFCRGPC